MSDILTIVHHNPDYVDAYYTDVSGDWDRVNQQRVWAYAVGKIAPRFPMPAQRLVVQIDNEFTAIWRYGVDCVYYQDEYETVQCGTVTYRR